jgi:DNA repair exonuclease SbcCD ATPase subunit
MSDAQRDGRPPLDPEQVARHEAHLVGQIYHLIEANQRLEEQLDRLEKVTAIAGLFRERRITGDTFELPAPRVVQNEDGPLIDADWLAEVRNRLIAAEQAIAFLNEQTRELDLLRREKDAIVDGAARLEQNIDDLWKALNEKTTHIQRLEAQLQRHWDSLPYRSYDSLRRLFRGGDQP